MIKEQIAFEEGIRLKKYRCTAGHLTIGIGHNIDAMPTFKGEKIPDIITKEFALELFEHDLAVTEKELKRKFPRITEFDSARRDAFLNMAFQMGVDGFMEFERMRAAALARDWETAARQALKSKWARIDSPNRAKRVAEQIRTGKYYEVAV